MALRTLVLMSAATLAQAAPMLAQAGPGSGLDLSLPDTTRFGVPYAPPGLRADDPDTATTSEDDGKAHVHGSFTTGIGYSKGLGSSTFNSADLNITKSVGDDHPTHLSLDIHVSTQRGPGFYGYGWDERGPGGY